MEPKVPFIEHFTNFSLKSVFLRLFWTKMLIFSPRLWEKWGGTHVPPCPPVYVPGGVKPKIGVEHPPGFRNYLGHPQPKGLEGGGGKSTENMPKYLVLKGEKIADPFKPQNIL